MTPDLRAPNERSQSSCRLRLEYPPLPGGWHSRLPRPRRTPRSCYLPTATCYTPHLRARAKRFGEIFVVADPLTRPHAARYRKTKDRIGRHAAKSRPMAAPWRRLLPHLEEPLLENSIDPEEVCRSDPLPR